MYDIAFSLADGWCAIYATLCFSADFLRACDEPRVVEWLSDVLNRRWLCI